MISSYAKSININLGYDTTHVLTMNFALGGKAYYSDVEAGKVRVTPQTDTYYREVLERIRACRGSMRPGSPVAIRVAHTDFSRRRAGA